MTGANQGVGYQIAKGLADNGYTVYVGSRNLQNGLAAVEKIGDKAQANRGAPAERVPHKTYLLGIDNTRVIGCRLCESGP